MLESMLLIFVASTVMASLALFARQPLIIVYVLMGCLLGPHGLEWITDGVALSELGEIGIIFLLFIVGLDLPPKKIQNVLRQSIITVLLSSILFFSVALGIALLFGFTITESVIAGVAAMFSSTVVGIKLLPNTVLHHRHIGELVIGLLLMQDVIAIAALLYLNSFQEPISWVTGILICIALPALVALAALGSKFIVWPLLQKFDVYTEYTFLLFIGWCMGFAFLAHHIGLSFEIGAFIAGVSLANTQAAQSIAQSLEPLRDFFLVVFFFYVGSTVDPALLWSVGWQVVVLGTLLVALKPLAFRYLIAWQGESTETAWEVGARLGQCSEFSILVIFLAASHMRVDAHHVVLGAIVLTLVISTYVVVFRFKNPIAISDRLRVD